MHESVGGEWSFIQTLRHLNFASAAWVGRMVFGDPSPWHPLDLPWDEAPGWEGIPWDREARPTLDEVLAVRRDRQAMVSGVIDALTKGGPAKATETLIYKAYIDGRVNLDIGSSSAQSVVLMLAVIVLTAIQFRFIERRVHY